MAAHTAVQTRGTQVAASAARPRVFRLVDDHAAEQRRLGWPVGLGLLEALGDLNPEVRGALVAERARLRHHGYPEDLPLPALWWTPAA